MSTSDSDGNFFSALHVIPLGYLHVIGGDFMLTVRDRPWSESVGIVLSEQAADLWGSIEILETGRQFSSTEQAILLELNKQGGVGFLKPTGPVSTLGFVPVLRAELQVAEVTSTGYRLSAGPNLEVGVSEYGGRMIKAIDNVTDLGRIAADVGAAALLDPADAVEIAASQFAELNAFNEFLFGTALETVAALHTVGAVSLESVV
jgi:hypothetical protein